MADQGMDKTRELAEEALDRADEFLTPVGLSIKERPMTVLAVIGGLAFAAGALWMFSKSRQHSRYDQGKVQQKVGEAKSTIKDVADKVADKAHKKF